MLKQKLPGVKIIGVEPARSPVLSGGRPGLHGIQGIGASFVPGVLNQSVIDRIVQVRDEDATVVSRRLSREEGLLVGVSAGAAVWAACEVAASMRPEQLVVTVLRTGEVTQYRMNGIESGVTCNSDALSQGHRIVTCGVRHGDVTAARRPRPLRRAPGTGPEEAASIDTSRSTSTARRSKPWGLGTR